MKKDVQKEVKKKEDKVEKQVVKYVDSRIRDVQSRMKAMDNQVYQALDFKKRDRVLNPEEHFLLNKAFPGSGPSPYVNNGTVVPLPTCMFSQGNSYAQASNDGGAVANYGSQTYTLIAWCPALTSFTFRASTTVANPPAAGTRLGGFLTYQTSNPTRTFPNNLWIDTVTSRSCIEVFGSDFTSFGTGGFVWSADLNLHLVAPAANLTGACFTGQMTLSQFNGIGLRQLMQDSSRTESGHWDVTLKSAVVNPDLVTDINFAINTNLVSDLFKDAENEIVSYVIYQTPAINITTGLPSQYSFIATQSGNFVYYPRATDPFAFALGGPDGVQNYNKVLTTDERLRNFCEGSIRKPVTNSIAYRDFKKKINRDEKTTIAVLEERVNPVHPIDPLTMSRYQGHFTKNTLIDPYSGEPIDNAIVAIQEEVAPRSTHKVPINLDEMGVDDVNDWRVKQGLKPFSRRDFYPSWRTIQRRDSNDMMIDDSIAADFLGAPNKIANMSPIRSNEGSHGFLVIKEDTFSKTDFEYHYIHVQPFLEKISCNPYWNEQFAQVLEWLQETYDVVANYPSSRIPNETELPELRIIQKKPEISKKAEDSFLRHK